ncbi:hypothetical protein [Nocardia sp. NPDC057227]|uniref:hypothetical protein n=1 Tax=Nocardia sp. NPDC057227 TaxID=3346056 RepID=UPI003639DCD2
MTSSFQLYEFASNHTRYLGSHTSRGLAEQRAEEYVSGPLMWAEVEAGVWDAESGDRAFRIREVTP